MRETYIGINTIMSCLGLDAGPGHLTFLYHLYGRIKNSSQKCLISPPHPRYQWMYMGLTPVVSEEEADLGIPLEKGDCIVMGSDGLSDVLSAYEMSLLWRQGMSSNQFRDILFREAVKRNNTQRSYTIRWSPQDFHHVNILPRAADNITVSVMNYTGEKE